MRKSENDRAVKSSKVSGFIKKGVNPNASSSRYNNVCLAWSFHGNFTFVSVV
jgi:hypothetical protein